MHENRSKKTATYRMAMGLQDDSGPFLVEVELAPVNGRIGCVGFAVRAYAQTEGELAEFEWMELPTLEEVGTVITASLFRRIKVAEHIAGTIGSMRSIAQYLEGAAAATPSSFDEFVATLGFEANIPMWAEAVYEHEQEFWHGAAEASDWARKLPQHAGRKRPGRPPVPDETLKRVAHLYTEAYLSGDTAPVKNVTRELRKERQVTQAQVKGWVRRARQKGFLPPTTSGTAKGRENDLED